jgi:hypothetical protein
VPSSSQAAQDQGGLGQHQDEAWDEEDSEDKATIEVELAQVQQAIERLRQEQEIITKRQAMA